MAKILVRAPQWLGDAVVSTIFISRLKEKNADSLIEVACPTALRPLFETHPAVHAVVDLPYSTGGNIFAAARAFRARQFDVVYILPRSLRTALEAWLARIPRRIGYRGDARGVLLSEAVAYESKKLYA